MLIERAVAELETQYPFTVSSSNSVKEQRSAKPRALHLGPGISAVGSKLCEAFEKRGWKGSDIIVWPLQWSLIHDFYFFYIRYYPSLIKVKILS